MDRFVASFFIWQRLALRDIHPPDIRSFMGGRMKALDPEYYHSKDIYRAEKQSIFFRSWVLVAHQEECREAGTQLARKIVDIPVLLWRTAEGVKAFMNICRHRGSPLVFEGETRKGTMLSCRYHGWRYDEKGTLISVTDFGSSCPKLQLQELFVQEIHGLIFIAIEKPQYALEQCFTGVWKYLEKRQASQSFYKQLSHRLQCNWKVYAENYLEGYHIPYVHPELAKEIRMSSYQVQVNNLEISHHVEAKDGARSEGYWAFLYPNLAINVYATGVNIERILPISETETEIQYWYFFDRQLTQQEKEESIQFSELVTKEDIQICEAVQKNIASGFHIPGPLSPRHENGLAAFQGWVQRAL